MDVEVQKIIDIFEKLNAVPRQSKHEEKVSRWLVDRAAALKLNAKTDSVGNIVVDVPASRGRENAPVVVLQGHMDMVCEKRAGSEHDFSKDPIEHVIDGDWLSAKDTSLGADNGIALAYCLAIAERSDLIHPPLELLFTVDEETGLNGAKALSRDFLKGRILLNLDSEEEGFITIGCAGGQDTILTIEPEKKPVGEGTGIEIVVGGLLGGHSGTEIHEHRANALKLLARLLSMPIIDTGATLVSISGGSARNAIPRDARAVIAAKPESVDKIIEHVKALAEEFASEHAPVEDAISIKTKTVPLEGRDAYDPAHSSNLVRLLRVIPSGQREFSSTIPDLVETSSNLAIVSEADGTLTVSTSQRSSVESRLKEISGDVVIAGALGGADSYHANSYPTWRPDRSSPLLKRSLEVYRRLNGQEAKIKAVHAGLECAVIGSIYSGMDMISFGPDIKNAHSPDERVNLPSIGKTWRLLISLLESFE